MNKIGSDCGGIGEIDGLSDTAKIAEYDSDTLENE